VAEIKIPDNTKFHKNISIMITPATLPSQRCVEWLLLAERGCCWRIMAAVSGSWLLLADHGCCWRNMAAAGGTWLLFFSHRCGSIRLAVEFLFSFPNFFFLANVRGYGVTPSEHVWMWFCEPFADAQLLTWWVKSAHLFRLTVGRLHT